MPSTPEFDYTISFWFRSQKSLFEMSRNYGNSDAYLFDIPEGPSCFIRNARYLRCLPDKLQDGDDTFDPLIISFDLEELWDFQAWIHVTYSANHKPGTFDEVNSYAYLRLDTSGFHKTLKGGYAPIGQPKIYYGINSELSNGI